MSPEASAVYVAAEDAFTAFERVARTLRRSDFDAFKAAESRLLEAVRGLGSPPDTDRIVLGAQAAMRAYAARLSPEGFDRWIEKQELLMQAIDSLDCRPLGREDSPLSTATKREVPRGGETLDPGGLG